MPNILLEITFHQNTPVNDVYPAPGLLWWQWALILLGAIIAITILYFFAKAIIQRPKPQIPAIRTFREEMNHIIPENENGTSFAVKTSTTFRHFLYRELANDSLFQTNEEINLTLLKQLKLNDTTNSQILDLLNQLESLKYSKGSELNYDPVKIKEHTAFLAESIHENKQV